MDLKQFIKKIKDDMLGMLMVQIEMLRELRDKTKSIERANGIQDAIDILEESVMTGMSITDEEVERKIKELENKEEKIPKVVN